MNTSFPWPALLGAAIQAKQQLLELEPGTHWETLPRVKNSESDVQRFEQERGERVPEQYRSFLLHADGWEAVYFGVGLFGIPELNGQMNGGPAMQLLGVYDDEEVLEASGVSRGDVYPVAAGQSSHLAVIIRRGPGLGRVIWFDEGTERGSFSNFKEFFVDLLALNQDRVERLRQ